MSEDRQTNHLVAVIGAGPAGLYASQYLARRGIEVVLFNRDIKPGGLAEYGIFPNKYKLRKGLMKQFKRILDMPQVQYLGNVTVGQSGDIKIDQLRRLGFQAFMVTTGAQANNWLGLPGEDLAGVYQANNIVFHYNRLPHREEIDLNCGSQVAIIGVGNVMLDVVHFLKGQNTSRTVTAYARRGPTEVKFDKQSLKPVACCLDMEAIKRAVDAVRPAVDAVGKDVTEFYELLREAREKAEDCDSGLQFRMQFLRSPRRLVGDEDGRVKQIVFEINRLVHEGDGVISRGTGDLEVIAVDTVIFSIGSRVEEGFGLPASHGHFITSPDPRFPIDGISYEVYNPELCVRCEDIFVSGWARLASEGVVGLARKDAERGARALVRYLETLEPSRQHSAKEVIKDFPDLDKPMVNLDDLEKLWRAEQKIAAEKGLPAYKFATREEMLRAIGKS